MLSPDGYHSLLALYAFCGALLTGGLGSLCDRLSRKDQSREKQWQRASSLLMLMWAVCVFVLILNIVR